MKQIQYINDFQQFHAIRSFFGNIFNVKITISEAVRKQSNLSKNILGLNSKARPRGKADKKKKTILLNA